MKHLVHLDGTVTTMEADYSQHRGRYEVGPFFGGATEREAVEAFAAHPLATIAGVLVADTAEDAEVMARLVWELIPVRRA